MEFEASFPSASETFALVEQGESLLDDVAELPQALMFGAPLREGDRFVPRASRGRLDRTVRVGPARSADGGQDAIDGPGGERAAGPRRRGYGQVRQRTQPPG